MRRIRLHIFTLLFAVLVLGLCIWGFRNVAASAQREQVETALQAVRRAAVQCYALEGAYPADLAYLQTHYGLILEDRLVYHYRALGANLMPEIQVFPVG